eukprot:2481542-Rhodomonas_salina.6
MQIERHWHGGKGTWIATDSDWRCGGDGRCGYRFLGNGLSDGNWVKTDPCWGGDGGCGYRFLGSGLSEGYWVEAVACWGLDWRSGYRLLGNDFSEGYWVPVETVSC